MNLSSEYSVSATTSERPTSYIPFARPVIGKEEEASVLEVLRSGWLTTGKYAAELETAFASYFKVPYAMAVNSATSGLHLALEALGIGAGDYVISSPYTFTATVEVARYLGAHPLFVDIEDTSFNIDPVLLEKTLRSQGDKVKCVVPVHLGGQPCDMTAISELANRYHIPIVEDAAHALPCVTNSGDAGTVGDAGIFSLYATKNITSGEGGILITQSQDIAARVGTMRLHGIDRDVWNRYQAESPVTWEYDVVAPGFKYNMPDLAAAVGLAQLRKVDDFHRRRVQVASEYLKAFKEYDFLIPPPEVPGHSWHLFILGLRADKCALDRDGFMIELMRHGIGVSMHYRPLHLMSYYKKTYGFTDTQFQRSVSRYRQSFSLPLYPSLSDEEVARIIDAVISTGKKFYQAHGS